MNAWSLRGAPLTRLSLCLCVALAAICVCAATATGSAGQEATVQLADQRIERALDHGQTQQYQLTLNAGEYVHAIVEQHGIDLVVRVLGPDAAILAEFQDEVTNQGHEDVEL